MVGHSVGGEEGVQEGIKHTPLWGPCVEGQRGVGDVAYLPHLGSARQEVQDPVCKGVIKAKGGYFKESQILNRFRFV